MNVATVLVLLVVAAVAAGLALRFRGRRNAAAVLRLLAVLFAVAGAAVAFPVTVSDSGAFAIWGLGLPVLVTLAPLLAARSQFGAAVTGVAAGFLLLAALAETAAAVAQRRPENLGRDLTGATPGG
jgi:hypothetical protein